jgi:Domain of unknown function (DUF5916)/Carbohydrate family 9 binding domain-like
MQYLKYLSGCGLLILHLTLIAFPQADPPVPASAPAVTVIAGTEPSSVNGTTMPGLKAASNPASPLYVRKDAPVRIPRFEKAPVIDGQLNDDVWQNAAVFGDFLETQPGDNAPPSNVTEVVMGYDAKNLYIAFRIKEPRDKVRATVAKRDNIFSDDYVGLYFDTFNDKRQAYCIFFNPLGVQADGVFTETNGEDYSVDLVMESKGVLTPDGFTIEVAIPFKSLRYTAGKDKSWGVHLFRRVKYNNNELDSWMPTNRSISSSLSQAGHITGFEGLETSRQIEVIPSFTLSETGRRTRYTFNNDPAGRYVNEGVKGDFGMTAKIGLTPTITLDFAYNPDFAQVEADAPVTTANQRFPIFFAEKRPFFLERIDIFRSPLDLVNTRAIIDPDIAAKLTGRSGKNTFGILYASDNAPGNFSKDERQGLFLCRQQQLADPNVICPIDRFVDQNADIGVLRLKRDIGKESSLGFFGTTYNFVEKHNNTGGFDGRIRFDPKTVAEFQIVGTNSRQNFYDPDRNRFGYRTGNGVGYNLWVERGGRNWYMNYNATGRSKDYRADVGFTQRVDTNYLGSYIRYQTDANSKKRIVQTRIQNATNVSYDWRLRQQYFITDSQVQISLHKQTFIAGNIQFGREKVYEHEFGPRRNAQQAGAFFGLSSERAASYKAMQLRFEMTPNKQLYLSYFMDYTAGLMEYDFGAGPRFPRVSRAAVEHGQDAALDPGPGDQLLISATIRYQPTGAFQTQLNYNKQRLVRDDTHLLAFDDNIYSSRSTYQFTRNTFARLRVDYSTLAARLRPQFVLGWAPNPGTALYVGYNDDLNYKGYNPYTGIFEPGIHGNGRSFFIKASYLFKRSF